MGSRGARLAAEAGVGLPLPPPLTKCVGCVHLAAEAGVDGHDKDVVDLSMVRVRVRVRLRVRVRAGVREGLGSGLELGLGSGLGLEDVADLVEDVLDHLRRGVRVERDRGRAWSGRGLGLGSGLRARRRARAWMQIGWG